MRLPSSWPVSCLCLNQRCLLQNIAAEIHQGLFCRRLMHNEHHADTGTTSNSVIYHRLFRSEQSAADGLVRLPVNSRRDELLSDWGRSGRLLVHSYRALSNIFLLHHLVVVVVAVNKTDLTPNDTSWPHALIKW